MKPRLRTTVTLDPELAAQLRSIARERGISFSEAVNSTVRRGLQRYQLASRRLGLRSGVDLEHALRLAGELEDAETIRKSMLGK
jgi:metal-responsive CopG/Arc/MetJ family transcriptional regulator